MHMRAATLFDAVFSTNESCIVVSQDWHSDNKPPTGLAHLSPLFEFARRKSVGLGAPQGQVELQEAEEPEVGSHTLTWVNQSARAFRYDLVFEGIANADHARSPAISSRVYFVNTRTNVIMHMYDDRGLDVIARSREVLQHLYRDFNAWILDYDRAQVDQTFSS